MFTYVFAYNHQEYGPVCQFFLIYFGIFMLIIFWHLITMAPQWYQVDIQFAYKLSLILIISNTFSFELKNNVLVLRLILDIAQVTMDEIILIMTDCMWIISCN